MCLRSLRLIWRPGLNVSFGNYQGFSLRNFGLKAAIHLSIFGLRMHAMCDLIMAAEKQICGVDPQVSLLP